MRSCGVCRTFSFSCKRTTKRRLRSRLNISSAWQLQAGVRKHGNSPEFVKTARDCVSVFGLMRSVSNVESASLDSTGRRPITLTNCHCRCATSSPVASRRRKSTRDVTSTSVEAMVLAPPRSKHDTRPRIGKAITKQLNCRTARQPKFRDGAIGQRNHRGRNQAVLVATQARRIARRFWL